MKLFHKLLKRQILMRIGPETLLTDFLYQISERNLRIHFGANHQRVDEKPNQTFYCFILTARYLSPYRDVVLPTVSTQKYLIQRHQKHEETHALQLTVFSKPQRRLFGN